MVCALVCALLCAPMAGVPVAQRISFSSDNRSHTKYYSPSFGNVANNWRSDFTFPSLWRVIRSRNASISEPFLDAPFLGGDFIWPNGPWPGEQIPYFTSKTGHLARHGIWPSGRH